MKQHILKGVVVLLGIGILVVLFRHPIFTTTDIEVDGQNFISSDALTPFIDSAKGEHLLLLMMGPGFKGALMDAFPQLDRIEMSIDFPGHLSLHLIEKKAWMSFWVDDESLLMAEDGTMLNLDGESGDVVSDHPLLVVRGLERHVFQTYQMPTVFLNHVREMGTLLRRYFPDDDLQVDFRGLEFVDGDFSEMVYDDVTLLMDDVLPIRLGNLDNLAEKIELLNAFFKSDHANRKKREIDLRVAGKLVVSYGQK